MSLFDKLLTQLPDSVTLACLPTAHHAFSKPETNPRFVKPSLRRIKGPEEKRPLFVLISAPGAVGKTTLARSIVGLVAHQEGEKELLQMPLPPRLSQRDLDTLRRLQMVFQNPQHALNPYQTVGEILRLPLHVLHGLSRDQAEREVQRLLESVHLSGYETRRPSQLSGGEVQRVALARAFAASPALLVADEPVSSLDVSVQAAVLNLLGDLQVQHGSAVLFISHNISVVGYLADQIAVMYAGRLVQASSQGDFFHPPYHPYTAELLSSVPVPQPGKKPVASSPGAFDDPLSRESPGCPYFQRCKHRLEGICDRIAPPWQVTAGGGRIYCHISPEELQAAQVERYRRDDGVERIYP